MASLKFIASQVRSIHQYKNLKDDGTKMLCWYFVQRPMPHQKIVPKYANIKVTIRSPASRITQNKIHMIRLKDEIEFLYNLVGLKMAGHGRNM